MKVSSSLSLGKKNSSFSLYSLSHTTTAVYTFIKGIELEPGTFFDNVFNILLADPATFDLTAV